MWPIKTLIKLWMCRLISALSGQICNYVSSNQDNVRQIYSHHSSYNRFGGLNKSFKLTQSTSHTQSSHDTTQFQVRGRNVYFRQVELNVLFSPKNKHNKLFVYLIMLIIIIRKHFKKEIKKKCLIFISNLEITSKIFGIFNASVHLNFLIKLGLSFLCLQIALL